MIRFTVVIALFLSVNSFGQDYYYINAKNGLNVRSGSDLSSEKIAKIRFGTQVEKIADTDNILTITDDGNEITGRFVKIKYGNYYSNPELIEVYVFDGFLKKQVDETLLTITKIDKKTYSNYLNLASKENKKPQKISNFESVKTALKGRVEWYEDALPKSITFSTGEKLEFEKEVIDFGFSEGYSAYYPEEDILVLEGGHSSDVSFNLKTGETDVTIGNPEYINASPKNTYRLNGVYGGQECVSYFFQKKEKGEFVYLTALSYDYDVCNFKTFNWISETEFIYSKMNYNTDAENGIEAYFKGEINVKNGSEKVNINKNENIKSIKTGLIMPNSAFKTCCIYLPHVGLTIYDQPNGIAQGKITLGEPDANNEFYSAQIKMNGVTYFLDGTNLEMVGYELFALVFVDSVSGFVKLKDEYWISIEELKSKNLKLTSWMDYMQEKKTEWYVYDPGLNLREGPTTNHNKIVTLKGALFGITLTNEKKGKWCKVNVTQYKKKPCSGEDNNILNTYSGWIKILSEDGTPNVWNYSKGCS